MEQPADDGLEIDAVDDALRVSGQVDLASVGTFRTAVTGAARPGTDLVLDLEACTFLGSDGIGVLIEAVQVLEGGTLVLRSPGRMVTKVLTLAGLATLANVRIDG